MPSCYIRECNARKNINQPELTLHRFPVNEMAKKKWIDIIGIEHINQQLKTWYVCSMHFDESCFNRTLDVARLRDGAIPSLSINVPDKSSNPISFKSESSCPAEVKFPETNLDINESIAKVGDKSCKQVLVERECSVVWLKESVNSNITAPVVKMPQQFEEINKLTKKCNMLKKKVRRLNEMVRRRDKKIARLSDIIKDLQNSNSIYNEEK